MFSLAKSLQLINATYSLLRSRCYCSHATLLPTNGCSHSHNIPFLHFNHHSGYIFRELCTPRNLTNHFACFILEFSAFKTATFEEAFGVGTNTFQILAYCRFQLNTYCEIQLSKRTSQETKVNFYRVKSSRLSPVIGRF